MSIMKGNINAEVITVITGEDLEIFIEDLI